MRLQQQQPHDFAGIFRQNFLDREKALVLLDHCFIRLAELFVAVGDKAVVNPILRKRILVAKIRLRLRNLVLVVRENQIGAAAVKVKFLSQKFKRHR